MQLLRVTPQIYFQWWEKKCKCGEDDPKKGIVQIFEETQDTAFTSIPFNLKIPICMGALISPMHVLTTKFCFGYLKKYTRQVEIDGKMREIPSIRFKEKASILSETKQELIKLINFEIRQDIQLLHSLTKMVIISFS